MAKYTTYKNLEKPLSVEKYDINVANKNNDVIDSELHKLELKNESQDNLLATKESVNTERERAIEKENKMSMLIDTLSRSTEEISDELLMLNQKINDLLDDLTDINDCLKKTGDSSETVSSGAVESSDVRIGIAKDGMGYPLVDLLSSNKLRLKFRAISDYFDKLYLFIIDKIINKIPTLTNNLLATVSGVSALDAAMGPVLKEEIDKNNPTKLFYCMDDNIDSRLEDFDFIAQHPNGIFGKSAALQNLVGFWVTVISYTSRLKWYPISQVAYGEKGMAVRYYNHNSNEWNDWEPFNTDMLSAISQINSDLHQSGLLINSLEGTAINDNFTFEDLMKRKTVTFFTNWTDSVNFPHIYGSGVVIPGWDNRVRFIIYALNPTESYGGLYYGFRDNTDLIWTKL